VFSTVKGSPLLIGEKKSMIQDNEERRGWTESALNENRTAIGKTDPASGRGEMSACRRETLLLSRVEEKIIHQRGEEFIAVGGE